MSTSRTIQPLTRAARLAARRPRSTAHLSATRFLSTTPRRYEQVHAEQRHPDEGKENIPAPLAYTADKYPHIKRDSRFSKLTPDHVAHFKTIIDDSPSGVIDGLESDASGDLDPYNADWMRKYRGQSKLVLRPKTTQQVSHILKYCNENQLAVVPQGGNSGLVGGSVPVFDEIVISMGRMNEIRSFDKVSGILVADAGVIMQTADDYLKEDGHVFPLDLGAKGSCQMGGLVATNAGGLRLLRYGSLHGNILGLEAVLPDGTIIDDLVTLRKNNTGYDIKQLFIGGEGTLGIVTGVSILCPQRSQAVSVAAFGVESFEKCQQTFVEAKKYLGEIISAFEFMDGSSQKLMKLVKDRRIPLEGEYPFYCLVETSGSNSEHDQEKLDAFLEHVMSEEIVADGTVAENQTQITNLWNCREGIAETLNHWGGVYKYDLSLPLPKLYSLVEATKARMLEAGVMGEDESHPVVDVIGYGHMGDSNLHLNVPVRKFTKDVEKLLEPWIYEQVQELKGSISAEHGLGIAKKDFIGYSRSDTMIGLMKQVKKLYDPNGIMNPYKYI